MKNKLLLPALLVGLTFNFSCKKDSSTASNLKIVTSSAGQNQTITANIDNTGYTNFNVQTIMAEGGSPLHTYTWSLDASSNPPAGITIGPLTGVVNRTSTSSTGLSAGTTTFRVKVSDGTSTVTGSVDLLVTSYTPGPAADFQQLSSAFSLKDGDANKAYGASLFAMGGVPPYSWTHDESYAGSVDLTNAGLTVDATAGIVRGTILNSASGTTIHFSVNVTDYTGTGAVYHPVYTIKVN